MSRVLLGVTGSVAATRTPALVAALAEAGHAVKVVATTPALYFFDANALPPGVLHTDATEWPGEQYARGDAVLIFPEGTRIRPGAPASSGSARSFN